MAKASARRLRQSGFGAFRGLAGVLSRCFGAPDASLRRSARPWSPTPPRPSTACGDGDPDASPKNSREIAPRPRPLEDSIPARLRPRPAVAVAAAAAVDKEAGAGRAWSVPQFPRQRRCRLPFGLW